MRARSKSSAEHNWSQARAPNNPKGIGASTPRLACSAYLGCAFENRINANDVVAEVRRVGGNGWASTALRLGMFVGRSPRVARASQPRALGRNPVGILERS